MKHKTKKYLKILIRKAIRYKIDKCYTNSKIKRYQGNTIFIID